MRFIDADCLLFRLFGQFLQILTLNSDPEMNVLFIFAGQHGEQPEPAVDELAASALSAEPGRSAELSAGQVCALIDFYYISQFIWAKVIGITV